MLLIMLLASFASTCVPVVTADIFFDYRHATADQVKKFKFCSWISAKNIATMPAPAFAGFERDCFSQIKSFRGINASQFSYIPPHIVESMGRDALLTVPPDAFAGTNYQQARIFEQFCFQMAPDQFAKISPSGFAGLTAKCIKNLRLQKVARIDAERFQQLTPDAIEGFWDNIRGLSADVFEVITADQLRRVSWNSHFSACTSIQPEQVGRIPAQTWGAGIDLHCWSVMSPKSIEAITAPQLMALPDEFIGNLTAAQTKSFARVCAGAQQFILQHFQKEAFQGLEGPCWKAMDDNALASLADWQLYALGNFAASGFRSQQWKRLPAAKVNKLYAATLHSLSEESCRVMSAAQLESICRVSIAGLRSQCIAALPTELGKSLDNERIIQLETGAFSRVKAPFFRQIRPSALGNLTAETFSSINSEAFSEIRPLQLKSIPFSAWSTIFPLRSSAINPLMAQNLQLEHLAAMDSLGWNGFTAMHHFYFLKRFGDAFLKAATLDKITNTDYRYVDAWWRQAECLNKMYDDGLISRQDGDYTPNWMVLLSRPKSVGMGQPVLPMTYLAGLRGSNITEITADGVVFITPTEFGTLTAEQLDFLCSSRELFREINPKQIFMVLPSVIGALKPESLSVMLSEQAGFYYALSCAQVQAITKQQTRDLNSVARKDLQNKLQWCQRPINDTIANDGDNGQRWSDRKLGRTYQPNCGIDVDKWEKETARRLAEEEQFSSTYVERQVPPVIGCPCNHTSCVYSECYTEPAATCQFVPGQSDQASYHRGSSTFIVGHDMLWVIAMVAVLAVIVNASRHYKAVMEHRGERLVSKVALQG